MKLVSDIHTVGIGNGKRSTPGVPVDIDDPALAEKLLTRGFRKVEKPKAKPKPKAKAKPKE